MQVTPHLAQPSPLARRDVFDDNRRGAELADDAPELVPESGACAGEPGSLAGSGDVLTGESSAKEVHANESCRSCLSNIGDAPVHGGPVFCEHGAAIVVLLDLEDDGTEARRLKAKL
jgi:hypothetical protein